MYREEKETSCLNNEPRRCGTRERLLGMGFRGTNRNNGPNAAFLAKSRTKTAGSHGAVGSTWLFSKAFVASHPGVRQCHGPQNRGTVVTVRSSWGSKVWNGVAFIRSIEHLDSPAALGTIPSQVFHQACANDSWQRSSRGGGESVVFIEEQPDCVSRTHDLVIGTSLHLTLCPCGDCFCREFTSRVVTIINHNISHITTASPFFQRFMPSSGEWTRAPTIAWLFNLVLGGAWWSKYTIYAYICKE